MFFLLFSFTAFGQSVYKVNYWTDGSVIALGYGLSIAANAAQYSIINRRCPCDRDEVNFIDRPVIANENKAMDIVANYTVLLAGVFPAVLDYTDVGLTKPFIEDMIVYNEVLAVNFGLVTIAKFGVQRPYPYMYRKTTKDQSSDPSDYLSFYSGHTSTVVSSLSFAAMTMSLRHPEVRWPWRVAAIGGLVVGTALVLSAEHFTTDVIVGGAVGAAIGILIPGMHALDSQWIKNIQIVSNPHELGLIWSIEI